MPYQAAAWLRIANQFVVGLFILRVVAGCHETDASSDYPYFSRENLCQHCSGLLVLDC